MKDLLTILEGDCIEQMRSLPAESVHLIVTSPPYFGLRDYKIPSSVWGGDPECVHDWLLPVRGRARSGGTKSSGLATPENGLNAVTVKANIEKRCHDGGSSQICSKCDAWLGAFGLEPSPHLYVEHSVMIFREAWRVLRRDGTLWINLGDSFCPSGGDRRDHGNGFNSIVGKTADAAMPRAGRIEQQRHLKAGGLKRGDLVGIPWRIALALQADGWYLRRDNIWFKPSPMPESVNGWRWEQHRIKQGVQKANGKKPSGWSASVGASHREKDGRFSDNQVEAVMIDCPGCEKCAPGGGLILRRGNWRCTTSHEYVFQFSKSANYFCDAEAAREKSSGTAHERGHGVNPKAAGMVEKKVVGYRATCGCNVKETVRAVVLDMFAGSFTTCAVAIEEGRSAIAVEINSEYIELGKQRCEVTLGMVFA